MPLPVLSMTSTSVECAEGLQSQIQVQTQSPRKFPIMHDQHTLWCEKWGTIYSMGKVWTSEKDDTVFYEISCQKGNRQITMIKHTGGWDMLHLLLRFNPKITNRSRHVLPLHLNRSQMLAQRCFSRISPSIWLQSIDWSTRRLLKCLILNHGLCNLICSGKSNLNNANRLLRKGWFRLIWVVKITINPSL